MGGARGRTLVIAAVGFLLVDSVLLIWAGASIGRSSLTVWGVLFGVGAVAVVVLWRKYLRHLVDLDEARSALSGEIERLRRSAGLPAPTSRRTKLS